MVDLVWFDLELFSNELILNRFGYELQYGLVWRNYIFLVWWIFILFGFIWNGFRLVWFGVCKESSHP